MKRSKLNKIFIYAAIRSQIKDQTNKAAYPQEQLAELIQKDERTIRNYIKELEDSSLIMNTEKRFGTGEYAHNVYQFDYLKNDYFILSPDIITENRISPKLKGLMMLIKTYCINGTNYLRFTSKAKLSELLHIGKNQLPIYLEELESKGFIKFIGNTLHLSNEYFKLSIKDNLRNNLYRIIYDYCLSLNTIPPYKDSDTNDIGLIAAEYPEPDMLLKALKERCPQLPETVSFAYLTKALINKRAETRIPVIHKFYL